jgi:azurin
MPAKRIRLDVVLIKGMKRALRLRNVRKRVDSTRPSGHNLVISDVALYQAMRISSVELNDASHWVPQADRRILAVSATVGIRSVRSVS